MRNVEMVVYCGAFKLYDIPRVLYVCERIVFKFIIRFRLFYWMAEDEGRGEASGSNTHRKWKWKKKNTLRGKNRVHTSSQFVGKNESRVILIQKPCLNSYSNKAEKKSACSVDLAGGGSYRKRNYIFSSCTVAVDGKSMRPLRKATRIELFSIRTVSFLISSARILCITRVEFFFFLKFVLISKFRRIRGIMRNVRASVLRRK